MIRGTHTGQEIPIHRAQARWRRAQSARRRVLTTRGRLTLMGFVVVCVALVGSLSDSAEPFQVPAAQAAGLPDVAAGAPRVHRVPRAESPPVRAPAAIVRRLPVSRRALDLPAAPTAPTAQRARLFEWVDLGSASPEVASPVRVEYTLDAELMEHVFEVLKRGRVELGTVVLLDPTTGRILAYASTDTERFSPTGDYPAASLVKVITAATALSIDPETAKLPCRYRGSPYRLDRKSIDPPSVGRIISLQRALATSNNKCFAQLAVHAVGPGRMMEALGRFGWLSAPAAAHMPGNATLGEERYDLGLLGSGLAGSRITPLHAAQLAATLVHGELVSPRWIERVVDAHEEDLPLPPAPAPRQVLDPDVTRELRTMLVETTRAGTARRAFRDGRGRPLLGDVRVAGKTGSLSGKDPDGRYEWFVGVAPADRPQIAIATVLVQGHLWWRNASQIAAEVLKGVFCEKRRCSSKHGQRLVRAPEAAAALAAISEHEMQELARRADVAAPAPLAPYFGD
jgi:hypothetical protein